MLDSNGIWQEGEQRIEDIVTSHYSALFCSSGPTEFTELLAAIQPHVSASMNQMLNRTFQGSKLYAALKQMYPLKSPGLDGMPPLFSKHFWPSIGHLVMVLDFLNSGIAPPMFNDMHVVLIPKNKDPKNISDYRPISLCNVIFKLASKVIANMLK